MSKTWNLNQSVLTRPLNGNSWYRHSAWQDAVTFGGGGDRGELTVGSLAGPVTPTPALKTESEDQNDDAKIGRSAGRRSHKIRMIRCGGVSSLKEIWLSIGTPGNFSPDLPGRSRTFPAEALELRFLWFEDRQFALVQWRQS